MRQDVLGEKYKLLREKIMHENGQGISIRQLSKQIGIDHASISRYENGERALSMAHLIEYQKYFNVSFDYLMGRIDDENPNIDDMAIHTRLGLSGKAISALEKRQYILGPEKEYLALLNELLSDRFIYGILHPAVGYMQSVERSEALKKSGEWKMSATDTTGFVQIQINSPDYDEEVSEIQPARLWKAQDCFINAIKQITTEFLKAKEASTNGKH